MNGYGATSLPDSIRSSVGPLNFLFFFQAEDGIRDFHVTGVQTCALPICASARSSDIRFYPAAPIDSNRTAAAKESNGISAGVQGAGCVGGLIKRRRIEKCGTARAVRSEERRVGKECRARWATYQ